MSVPETTLVPPASEQVSLIRSFLEQLARDEAVPRAGATDDFLQRTLFGESPAATARLICHQRPGEAAPLACGLAVYSWKWGAFSGVLDMYLHVLFVEPAFRGRGIAQAAVADLMAIAQAHGATRLELLTTAGNDRAAAFYDKLGIGVASHMVVRRKSCPSLETAT
ncbi:GNAT family N-acetyltransferase [Roseateles sp. L2-2]|uniref:GNAT family N-acetyltransferase n=1 Tax=Roseateles sp. L2-2 TaxID=3422597 RepID=UPI003D35CD1E